MQWINISSGWIKIASTLKQSFSIFLLSLLGDPDLGGRGGGHLQEGEAGSSKKCPGEDGGDKPGLQCEKNSQLQVGRPGWSPQPVSSV